MAISVTEELIAGHSYRFSYTTNELRRRFLVSGLTPGPGILIQASTAIDAATPTKRIPPFASVHPFASNLVADDFDIKPFLNSQDSAYVDVLYHPITFSPTFQPIVEFNGTTVPITTNYDVDGNPIKVFYIAPDGTSGIEIGQVTHRKSLGILTVERVEYEDPKPRLIYIDKMNASPFWGTPKWTWVVRDINIRQVMYTAGFLVKYTLEYDPKTHIKTAFYRDPITGNIPQDVDTNPDPTDLSPTTKGYRNSKQNIEIDFSGMSLPNGFVS